MNEFAEIFNGNVVLLPSLVKFCKPAEVKLEVVLLYDPTSAVKFSPLVNVLLSVILPVHVPVENPSSTVVGSFAVQFCELLLATATVPSGWRYSLRTLWYCYTDTMYQSKQQLL